MKIILGIFLMPVVVIAILAALAVVLYVGGFAIAVIAGIFVGIADLFT